MVPGLGTVGINAMQFLCWVQSTLAGVTRYLAGLSKPSTDVLLDEAGRLETKMNALTEAAKGEEGRSSCTRTQNVCQLLEEASKLLTEVENFKHSCIYRTPCFKDLPFWVTDLLQRVEKLKDELDKELSQERKNLVGEKPLPEIKEVPDQGELVGQEETLLAILNRLKKNSRIIRIYGLPGIGKTVLLQRIYHMLRGDPEKFGEKFAEVLKELKKVEATVIFAKVSTELDVLDLQRDIARQLGLALPDDKSSSKEDRRRTLEQRFPKKFVLLLDDVEKEPSWESIGIPAGSGNIIFTTNSLQNGYVIKIKYLNPTESWDLFNNKLENRPDVAVLEPMRTAVINRGGGLPRAIEAMAQEAGGMQNSRSWQQIAQMLQRSPHELNRMKGEVFPPLIRIIDNHEEKYKKCLLYCSLFPEDLKIYSDQLIDYWIGEGFLENNLLWKASKLRNDGRKILDDLVGICFLEGMPSDEEGVKLSEGVKLHDVVRSMLMWLTDGTQSEQSKLYLMSTRLEEVRDLPWEKVERIASMNVDGRREFPDKGCQNLVTVLYNNYKMNNLHREQQFQHANRRLMESERSVDQGEQGNLYGIREGLKHLVGNFFFFYSSNHNTGGRSMEAEQCIVTGKPMNLCKLAKNLKVLDLSGTNIGALPEEISCLDELQYLNVSYTNIRSLPSGLSMLKRLKYLQLRGTHNLKEILGNSIPSLLEIFDIFNSGYAWNPTPSKFPQGQNLESFPYLDEIGLTILGLQKHGESARTASYSRGLHRRGEDSEH